MYGVLVLLFWNDWGKVSWAAFFRILTFLARLGQGFLGHICQIFDFSGTTGSRFFWVAFFRIMTFLARLGQGFLGRICQNSDFSGTTGARFFGPQFSEFDFSGTTGARFFGSHFSDFGLFWHAKYLACN